MMAPPAASSLRTPRRREAADTIVTNPPLEDAIDAVAAEVRAQVRAQLRAIDASVHDAVFKHPLVALGAAAGLGFVLGGAAATPALRSWVRGGAYIAIGVVGRQLCEVWWSDAQARRRADVRREEDERAGADRRTFDRMRAARGVHSEEE